MPLKVGSIRWLAKEHNISVRQAQKLTGYNGVIKEKNKRKLLSALRAKRAEEPKEIF